VVEKTRNKNLFFSTDVDSVIEDSDVIFISVNTPTKTHGIGAGRAANIKNCELAARNIAKVVTKGKIVVEKSTVPVRTAHAVATVLANNDKGLKFQVIALVYFLWFVCICLLVCLLACLYFFFSCALLLFILEHSIKCISRQSHSWPLILKIKSSHFPFKPHPPGPVQPRVLGGGHRH